MTPRITSTPVPPAAPPSETPLLNDYWTRTSARALRITAEGGGAPSTAEVYGQTVHVQRLLNREGFLRGDQDTVADGKFGRNSTAALAAYLERYPMPSGTPRTAANIVAHIEGVMARREASASDAVDAPGGSATPAVDTGAPARGTGGALSTPGARSGASTPAQTLEAAERTMLRNYHAMSFPEPHTRAELSAYLRDNDGQLPPWLLEPGNATLREQVETHLRSIREPFGKSIGESSLAELLAESNHHQRAISLSEKGIGGPSAVSREQRYARLQLLAAELERRSAPDSGLSPGERYRAAGEASLALSVLAYEVRQRSTEPGLDPGEATRLRDIAQSYRDRAEVMAARTEQISGTGAFYGASELPRGMFWRTSPPSGGAYEMLTRGVIRGYDEAGRRAE